MYTSIAVTLLALSGSALSAPAAWTDPTACAPGTGYYQKCANGYTGCSTVDMCSPWAPSPADPTVCAPGTGYYQKCANGYAGCSTTDMCAPPQPPHHHKDKRWTCTVGYYQKCANGFDGCSTEDECSKKAAGGDRHEHHTEAPVEPPVEETPVVEHVPTVWPVPANNGVCPPNTGYYQVCNGGAIKGCCKQDMCGLGYCPYTN